MTFLIAFMMVVSSAADEGLSSRGRLYEIKENDFPKRMLNRAFVEVNCTITSRCIEYFGDNDIYIQSGDLIPFHTGMFVINHNQICTQIGDQNTCRIFYFSKKDEKLYSTDPARKNMKVYTYTKEYIPSYYKTARD